MFSYLKSFADLFYPRNCVSCSKSLSGNEEALCSSCIVDLPTTGFHQIEGNPVEKMFWGRIKIERATSFFYFEKGSRFQKILHQIKYKGKKQAGIYLGRLFSRALEGSSFHDVDLLLPVPLHSSKKRRRGFNQSELIARGLSQGLNIPVNTKVIYRRKATETQTRKGRYDRWKNVEGIFTCRDNDELTGKHILLIDDVVTTGATIEALGEEILKLPGTKISVATLAYAT